MKAQGNALGHKTINAQSPEWAKQWANPILQSLANNLIHLIYSTKNREPILRAELRPSLYAYQSGILNQLDCPAIVIGGVADHVHTLFCLSKNCSLAKAIEELKKGSSKWLKTQGRELHDFHWQAGYGAFSVSQSSVEEVKRYIEQQEEHHRKRTFQEELIALLRLHDMEYNKTYLWD